MLQAVLTPELKTLRAAFMSKGFDLRLVGGVVRDLLRGSTPKDIDLCTDADPDEQIAVYKAGGYSYHETGIQHGTITVVLAGEPYEITSLRTETDHDGRHATVSYTRDWLGDLGRRDLTINAMALTFDGDLIDPFGGVADLSNNVVRFVGSPDDRMNEDYLRILRWLRFHGRMAPTAPLDPETVEAARRCADGLRGISRERVWMEMSKIIAGDGAVGLIDSIYDLGLADPIGLSPGNVDVLEEARGRTRNPVSLMCVLVNSDVVTLAADWKWSSEERDLALFLNKFLPTPNIDSDDFMWMLAHEGHRRDWVVELARLVYPNIADHLATVEIPVFPVRGSDLLCAGMEPGQKMGVALKQMKKAWAESNYTLDRDALMSAL